MELQYHPNPVRLALAKIVNIPSFKEEPAKLKIDVALRAF
jgi:hypothetical protein